MTVVEPYRVAVPDDALDDVCGRLGRTRWTDQLPGSGWDYGANLGYLRELCDYWQRSFDRRAAEARLNVFPQFVTTVDGLHNVTTTFAVLAHDTGYWKLQETRPQTVASALNDPPAGLAAWIVEKFRAWTDCDGDVERASTKDELLTNVAIYWFTQTIGSSAWATAAFNLVRWQQVPQGGHFAAVQVPDLYMAEVREFFRSYRTGAG